LEDWSLLVYLLGVFDQPLQQWLWRVSQELTEFRKDELGVRPGVISAIAEYSDNVFSLMERSRRFELVEHLSDAELDRAIDEAQKADETRLVRRLCFIKNLYGGKTQQQAGEAVGVSQPTSSRWARAWNQDGVKGLRPRFGGGRPPKLTSAQWDEICAVLEINQPWTAREILSLIEDRFGVTYHPTHLARKLRASGMHYAKPRPMDPRSPEDAEEILAERLSEALGEDDAVEDDPVVLGFFR
jgi:putative transposase